MRGLFCILLLSLCVAFTSPAQAASTSIPAGAMAAKFVFKNTYPDGSFGTVSGSGTAAVAGSGHPATRVFNADGSLLASSTTDSSWPKWITSVELGISGAANVSATNTNCARFAAAGESATKCCFTFTAGACGDPEKFNCGTSTGIFRVSEKDCMTSSSTTIGTGGPNDGVYIRLTLNRDTANLGASENIMAVVEYAGASLRPASQDPTACFTNGKFTPTAIGCSDFSWQLFLKHSASEVVLPFTTMIPPAPFALRTNASNVSGAALIANSTVNAGSIATKQFILPLSRDSNLRVLQFSRITAMPTTTKIDSAAKTFADYCNNSNSPLCVGLVIYSITLYRM